MNPEPLPSGLAAPDAAPGPAPVLAAEAHTLTLPLALAPGFGHDEFAGFAGLRLEPVDAVAMRAGILAADPAPITVTL